MKKKLMLVKLEENKNEPKAVKMKKYMRNQFNFLGIQPPLRNKITKPYFNEVKKDNEVDWEFINTCWDKPYREAQYVAIDYLKIMKDKLKKEDLDKIRQLLIKKSWWDTIDGFYNIIGNLALKEPSINETLINWSVDDNIWLKRSAIIHQLGRRDKTNEELLSVIIINNLNDKEFFINKAIGWALREYSKTNPRFVISFIAKNKSNMSKLSIREASKRLT